MKRSLKRLARFAAAVVIPLTTLHAAYAQEKNTNFNAEGFDLISNQGQDADADDPGVSVVLPDGASLDDSAERLLEMARTAEEALENLMGGSLPSEESLTVDELNSKKHKILLMRQKVEEAKLAKELWVLVNGKDQLNEKVVELERENAALQEQLREIRSKAPRAVKQDKSLPVVYGISGVGRKIQATLLVPYHGKVTVNVGTILPNGMRVHKIGENGIVVTDSDTMITLPSGTSVPLTRPYGS
ncbi:type IV pilus biogenesis protein PilP [Flexibacterium corallicola]|uniref:type IV pilus biogenesis protein PilP n=1 Tax=Flexibacterium corallicola TaxID=3037259 RepID=UPI00286EEBAC|nr:type IV pilus biogenesis protein PilP [Pseudovibrio sp. M1P-2-3]